MNQERFPTGWDEQRVKRLVSHYESVSDEEQAVEDEAAVSEQEGQAVITVPATLLPVIRQLLARASNSPVAGQ